MGSFFLSFYASLLDIIATCYSYLASIDIGGSSLLQYIITISICSFFLPILFTIVRRENADYARRSRRSGKGGNSDS